MNDDALERSVLDRVANHEDKGDAFITRLLINPRFLRALLRVAENRERLRKACIDTVESMDDRQLASLVNCSVSNIRAMRQAQFGPPFYFMGRLVRYKTFDVLEWVEKQKTTTAPKSRSVKL